MYWQPEESEIVDEKDFASSLAKALVDYIRGPGSNYVSLVECRCFKDWDLVSFDLVIERPQRPVYDIRSVESITVCFQRSEPGGFSVLVPRPDFPDTPHQSLMIEGFPAGLCIDDRPWQDTKSFYTAAELMGRLSGWFEKACQGELHGAAQPLDPLFIPDNSSEIILQADFWSTVERNAPLFIWAADKETKCLFVSGRRPGNVVGNNLRCMAVHCSIQPQAMARMKRAPRDLGQLSDFLTGAGVDFQDVLERRIKDWIQGQNENGEGMRLTCFLISMPQINPATKQVGITETVAFVSPFSPGEIGEKMGFLYRNGSDEAKEVNFLPTFGARVSMENTRDIQVQMSFVHSEFDAEGAAVLSGGDHADNRRILMVGAGSAGSTISETLVRQGLFKWTLVDNDTLLPHNIARHTLTGQFVGQKKAVALAGRLNLIRPDVDVRHVVENFLAPKDRGALDERIAEAELILDASASVPVSRWVSDLPGTSRRMCAFFSPDGRSGIVMIEDQARTITLRDLEAAYLREVLVNDRLQDHLGAANRMQYTGACRSLTNRIPMASIQILSGIISAEIASGSKIPASTLKIWTIDDQGVGKISVAGETCRLSERGWTVAMPVSLKDELRSKRSAALPDETGGSLMGMIDFERRRIDVVGALAPPADSVGTTDSFTRGVSRLKMGIEAAASRAGNQIRYIGEWHSHPEGMSSAPSKTDLAQILQLKHAMEIEGLPAISVIVAEKSVSVLIGGPEGAAHG